MLDFIKTKRHYIMALAVMFVFISLSDTTYSLFFNADSTSRFDYTTGLLDLKFVEDEQIQMANALPIIDSVGEDSRAYKLTIRNVGSLPYLFDLQMVSTEIDNVIDNKYIKFQVNDGVIKTLASVENIISSNNVLFPEEEITFNIRIWLDINTPNAELGKSFNAKVVTKGTSLYKTLDDSGANYPKLNDEMMPIYYDNGVIKKADISNTTENNKWYDYDDKIWANVAIIRDSDKKIYDLGGSNDITIDSLRTNNGNLVTDENYLDLGISNYNYNNVSNIFRIKFNDIGDDKIYVISNDIFEYYYDTLLSKFVFKVGNDLVYSDEYEIVKGKWYILGYTYNHHTVNFYVVGENVGEGVFSKSINSNSSFKLATDSEENIISNLEIGDVYFYNDILSKKEIENSYSVSLNLIMDNLVYGYNYFKPQTIKELYNNSDIGTIISKDDIADIYVWIPRFKYKLWNVLGEEKFRAYDIDKNGIDIVFEQDNVTSGVVFCSLDNCYSDVNMSTLVSENDNNKYFTHPAFENGITGIWISKYDKNVIDNSLLIKNTEWGALAYLSYSKYGICDNGNCNLVTTTNNNDSGVVITNSSYAIDGDYSNNKFILGDATKEFGGILAYGEMNVNFIRHSLFDYEFSSLIGNVTKEVIK